MLRIFLVQKSWALKKWWTFIITLKYSFFWRLKVLIPCFKMYYKKWVIFLKAFEDFCLKLWRTLSEVFRYLTFFSKDFQDDFETFLSWKSLLDIPPKVLCQFNPAILLKVFVNPILSFGCYTGPESAHANSSFSHLSHLHSPLEKYCCLGYKTIRSQPTSENCGLRDTTWL